METYDIWIIICVNPVYFKSQYSPLIPYGCDKLGMTDKILLRSNKSNLLSVIRLRILTPPFVRIKSRVPVVTHGIGFITWINTRYFKTLLSTLICFNHDGLVSTEKLVLSSNWDHIISVVEKWCHCVKFSSGMIAFNSYIEVID